MKRSEIKINVGEHSKTLNAELTRRWAVNKKEVKEKRMSDYNANKDYLIFLELKELMELAEKKGMSISTLKKMIEEYEYESTPRQGSIQFPN